MDKTQIRNLKIHKDERGTLFEILRKEHIGKKTDFGQIYVTTVNPGYAKGNHYHTRKIEWFCVIKGEGILFLEDINTGDKEEIYLNETDLKTVKIPIQVAHTIKNIGETKLYLLAYIDEPFFQTSDDVVPFLITK